MDTQLGAPTGPTCAMCILAHEHKGNYCTLVCTKNSKEQFTEKEIHTPNEELDEREKYLIRKKYIIIARPIILQHDHNGKMKSKENQKIQGN
jgi:hypothetical protein